MTIYDIARELGVSASTVSRVMNHKPNVKEATRRKVEELLKKYNYSPDEAAQGLAHQSSRIIGIMVTDIRIRHHAEGAYIIERRLAKLGYTCIIFNTGKDEASLADSFRRLASRRVEAVVMIGSVFQNELVKELIAQYLGELPVVMMNGRMDLPTVFGVLADEEGGVRSCVALLHSKGRKHIAFLNDDLNDSSMRKQAGFARGMEHYFHRAPLVIQNTEGLPFQEFGLQAATALLRDHPELDGLICATDLTACGALNALADMGIRVPEQVAVVGVDNSLYAEVSRPQLTSLDNRLADLGFTCAETLVKLLEKQSPVKECMILSRIVERQST